VRYCPATDIVLISAVPDLSNIDPDETLPGSDDAYQLREEYLNRIFPRNDNLFMAFRDVVTSFQHVAFYCHGQIESGSSSENTSEDESHFKVGASTKMADLSISTDFQFLLFYFTSLKQLLAWPDPQYWPEVRENTVIVSDISDDLLPKSGYYGPVHNLLIQLSNLMSQYNEYAESHNNHFAEDDEHWTAKAKPLERIGCYAARSWLVGYGKKRKYLQH
jgi:hypothetical protein